MHKNNLMLKHSLDNYVVSSRIRLARNVEGFNFPPCITVGDALKVVDAVSKPLTERGYKLYLLKDTSELEIRRLMESHLISSGLIENRAGSAVLLDGNNEVSVMLNEEDHVRLQVILRGLELDRAYAIASSVDDVISESVKIVYDDKLGYMTSCPTNLGTGMRASVMMFLPALIINNTITKVVSSVSMSKMTLRGVYGEGSKAEGFMYQLSNQHTLGLNEKEIISNVQNWINRIASAEEQAREAMYASNKAQLTDEVMRAWGILTNCYMINSADLVKYISFVKLGIGLDIIKLSKPQQLDVLITECQPGNLAIKSGAIENDEERDIIRAEYLRKALKAII